MTIASLPVSCLKMCSFFTHLLQNQTNFKIHVTTSIFQGEYRKKTFSSIYLHQGGVQQVAFEDKLS